MLFSLNYCIVHKQKQSFKNSIHQNQTICWNIPTYLYNAIQLLVHFRSNLDSNNFVDTSLHLNQSCQLYNSKYAPKNQLFILLALCSTISIPPDAQLRRPSGGVWGDLAKIRLTSSLSFLFGPPLWRVLGSLIIALNKFCGWLDIAQDACNCNLLYVSRTEK